MFKLEEVPIKLYWSVIVCNGLRDELISSVCVSQERSVSCPAGTVTMKWSFCQTTWRPAALWDITGWTLPKSRFVFFSLSVLACWQGMLHRDATSWVWLKVWGDTPRTADIGLCLMIHQCHSSVSRLRTLGSTRSTVFRGIHL